MIEEALRFDGPDHGFWFPVVAKDHELHGRKAR